MSAPSHRSPAVPPALTALSGTVLEGRYELGPVLGAGGMGAVFTARHLRLDRPVAIKVLMPSFAGQSEYIERFLREAKAASKIRHRNVVEILDHGEAAGGLVYSVMEFLVGQDLKQLLQGQPDQRLPWEQAYGLLLQIVNGLKAAHGQGVIHRDIKPANCFVTDEDGEPVVKLLDFGIAKLDDGKQEHALTGTAQVLGTPSYIAPELARTHCPANPRSDIYSFGVLTYRVLTGRAPFVADTVFELLRRACFDPVPSMRAQVPGLPPPVEAFVLDLLAKAPEHRPQDMLTIRDRLMALGQQTLRTPMLTNLGSRPLQLNDGERQPNAETTEDTTLTRSAQGRLTTPRGPKSRAPPPLSASPGTSSPPGSAARPTVVELGEAQAVAPAPAPALPALAGDTMPALADSTLHGTMDEPSALAKSRRRAGVPLLLGGAAILLLGGVFVVPAVLSALDEPTPEVTARQEPSTPVPDPEDARGELERAPTPPRAIGELDVASEPDDPTSDGGSTSDGGGSTSGSPEPAESEPEPEVKKTKPSSHRTRHPSDSVLIKRLERKIRSHCGASLGERWLTMRFLVTTDGEISGLTASLPGAAGACAKSKVKGTKFRTRTKSNALEIVVD